MRAALMALGSRGDTQPLVAIGAKLAERGHEAVVIAPDRYEDLIRGAGLEFASLQIDLDQILESDEGRELVGGGALHFVRSFGRILRPMAGRLLADLVAGARGADVVVAPPVAAVARTVSEHLGVPRVLLHFQPSEVTREFANPLLQGRELGGRLNHASYRAIELATGVLFRSLVTSSRQEVLGLPPLPADTSRLDRLERVPVLCGVSPHVVPRPADWPSNVHLTGAWTLRTAGELDASLEAFLDAGPPPVWVGFGSMEPADRAATAAAAVRAARAVGRRIVLQDLPLDAVEPGDDVHLAGDTDHTRAFLRTAAVVHHGGAGTTAASMTAGVPTLVCPFFGDQPYWASVVARLGVGPQPLPFARVTAPRLESRLRQATTDSVMIARSRALGMRLRREDGAGNAARLVETYVRTGVMPADEPGAAR